MRINKLLSIGLLTVFGLSAIAQVASAGAGKESGTGDIYITGFGSRQNVTATYSGFPEVRSATANECGFLKLSTNAMGTSDGLQFAVDGVTKTYGSIPLVDVTLAPKCSSGVASNVPSGGVAKYYPSPDSDASIVWTGKTPFTKYDITLANRGSSRKATANACGVIKLSNGGGYVNPTGTISTSDGMTYTVAELTSFGAGPGCKNNTLLLPSGWP